jgi:hypothetical protein
MASTDARVRDVVRNLGISSRGDPTPLVVDRCVLRVAGWCTEIGQPDTFEDLLEIVAAKLRLRFEVVESDDDLARVRSAYLGLGELCFVELEKDFREGTDAVVVRLQHVKPWSDVIFVAVVDGRGLKRSRVWFSKWHEIAHLIAEPQTSFVFRRTTTFKREPIERLMDQIAAALAFYEPLFLPALRAHGVDFDQPRLKQLREFHKARCQFASLHATLQAVLRHVKVPAILIEAKPAVRVRAAHATSSASAGIPSLRAVTTAHNPAAQRARFFIHRNMRIPKGSVIARVLKGRIAAHEFLIMREDMSWWESDGERLPPTPVFVEAMRAGDDRALALCTKATDVTAD